MKIIEIIPDDLPDYAIKAIAEGQLFHCLLNKIKALEKKIKKLKALR